MSANDQIDAETTQLLVQYEKSRNKLEDYVSDVESLRNKVSAIFPQDLNYRNKFVLEDKLKVMSSFYSTLLNIRQEINKSIKDEVEIRRKLKPPDEGKGEKVDIRDIVDQIEGELEVRKQKNVVTDLSLKDNKDDDEHQK